MVRLQVPVIVGSFTYLVNSVGWIQLKLAEKANLELANSKQDLTQGKGNQSRVGAAIDQLEASLKK
jgi:hypothetical protein